MVDLKSEEILTYLCLIVVGYFLAKMFSLRCDGFSVGGQSCENLTVEDNCNKTDGCTYIYRGERGLGECVSTTTPCTNLQDCNNNADIDDDGKDMVYGYRPNCQCLCKNNYTGRSCDRLLQDDCILLKMNDCISHKGCYFKNNTCKSCESIDLSQIENYNKVEYCSGSLVTDGACRYDLTSDKCISND